LLQKEEEENTRHVSQEDPAKRQDMEFTDNLFIKIISIITRQDREKEIKVGPERDYDNRGSTETAFMKMEKIVSRT
jgi:hypothetical protein